MLVKTMLSIKSNFNLGVVTIIAGCRWLLNSLSTTTMNRITRSKIRMPEFVLLPF
jgi:hypothetical protein